MESRYAWERRLATTRSSINFWTWRVYLEGNLVYGTFCEYFTEYAKSEIASFLFTPNSQQVYNSVSQYKWYSCFFLFNRIPVSDMSMAGFLRFASWPILSSYVQQHLNNKQWPVGKTTRIFKNNRNQLRLRSTYWMKLSAKPKVLFV